MEKIPYVIVAIAVAAIALGARFFADGGVKPSGDHFGITQRIAQACYVCTYYLWKPLAPADLSPFYSTLLTVNPLEARFSVSLILVVAITVITWRRRASSPGFLALWVCHLGLLLPVVGLTEHPHFPSDRYNYFVAVCWSVGLALILLRFDIAKWRVSLRLAAVSVVAILAISTYAQAAIWKNSVILLEHITAKLDGSPPPPGIIWRLANAYGTAGKTDPALGAYRQYVAASSPNSAILAQIAGRWFHFNRLDEAQHFYVMALVKNPGDADLHNAYGIALGAAGKFDEALREFHSATRLDPEIASPWRNIALVLRKQGKLAEAEEFQRTADRVQAAQSEKKVAALPRKP
jgi:hypothetical protein